MRYVYFILLMLFLAALTAFALANRAILSVGVPFFPRRLEFPTYFVILASYVLGMLSGWTVVGFVRSSIRRASEPPPARSSTS